MVYVALKTYNDAAELLKKALEIDPEFNEAQEALRGVTRILKQAG